MSRCKLRMLFEPVLVPSFDAWLLAGAADHLGDLFTTSRRIRGGVGF
jgi:hypothetical protein